jgi:hypothetical protein
LACSYGGRRPLVADISERDAVVAIVAHLELPTESPPIARARSPACGSTCVGNGSGRGGARVLADGSVLVAGGWNAGALWTAERYEYTEPSQLGEPCSLPVDCASTFCVDGVCCDTECTGILRIARRPRAVAKPRGHGHGGASVIPRRP